MLRHLLTASPAAPRIPLQGPARFRKATPCSFDPLQGSALLQAMAEESAEFCVQTNNVLLSGNVGEEAARLRPAEAPSAALICAAYGCEKNSLTSTGTSWEQSGRTCWRCHECTSYGKKLSTALKTMRAEDADAWRQKTKGEKLQFKERNGHLIAADLPTALKTWVTEARR